MSFSFVQHRVARWCVAVAGMPIVFAVVTSGDARQTPAAQPAAAGQGGGAPQTPAPAGRGNQADTGPVRDANNAVIGFTKLAEIPGTPWRIHDAARRHTDCAHDPRPRDLARHHLDRP